MKEKEFNLIICDDCSKDNTLKIAESYAKNYPENIKVIKNERNLTLGPTLNRCLELATGDYIARQDGDDLSKEGIILIDTREGTTYKIEK